MKSQVKIVLSAATFALASPDPAFAVPLTEAQITHIVKDVRTVDPGKTARPARLRETLNRRQAVVTGIDSRSELLFNDLTLTRIGANSHFSFTEGTRSLELYSGVLLLQVPKGAGGARIRTAAITAGVTGTTILMEAGPGFTKFIVIEGKASVTANNDKSGRKTTVRAGHAVILPNAAKRVPPPVIVNLAVLVKTSRLASGPWPVALDHTRINAAIAKQEQEANIPTNIAIIGPGTGVVFLPQIPRSVIDGGGDPTPDKFGPPAVIKGTPFVLAAANTIATDPTITGNGRTDSGKIYRGSRDGTPTDYVFGNGAGPQPEFDDEFAKLDRPAVFRFESLQLQGGPEIDTSGGGSTDLVLASMGAITSGGAGAQTFDLSALDSLTLAALGPISLDSDLTIRGSGARLWLFNGGSGSDIVLNSAVNLSALQIDSGGALSIGGRVDVNRGIWSSNGALQISAAANASDFLEIRSGGDVTLGAAVTTPRFELETAGTLSGGGRINAGRIVIDSANPLTVSGAGGLNLNGIRLGTGSLESLDLAAGAIALAGGVINLPTVDLVLRSPAEATAATSLTARNLTLANLTAPGSLTLNATTGTLTVGGILAAAEVTLAVKSLAGTGSISASQVKLTSTGPLALSQATELRLNGVTVGLGSLQSLDLTAGPLQISDAIDLPSVDLILNGNVEVSETANSISARNLTISNLTMLSPGPIVTLNASGNLTLLGSLIVTGAFPNGLSINDEDSSRGGRFILDGNVVADGVAVFSPFGGTGSIDAGFVSVFQNDPLTVSDGKVNGVALGLGRLQVLTLISSTLTNFIGDFTAPNVSLTTGVTGPTMFNGTIRVGRFDLDGPGTFSGGTVDADDLFIRVNSPGVDGTFIKSGASAASFNALTLDLTHTMDLGLFVSGNLTANVTSGFTNNPRIDWQGDAGLQINGDLAVGRLFARSNVGPLSIGGKINALGVVNLFAGTNIIDTSGLSADQDHISGTQISITNSGGPAIFSQTAATRVGYGPLRLDVSRTTDLFLSANPTQIVGDISLPGITLTVDGVVQAGANNTSSTAAFSAPASVNGGRVAFNVDSLQLGSASQANGGIELNGGDANAGGDGGAFSVNARSDITVNTPITATTGRNMNSTTTGGAGGTVDLTSNTGTVAVNSTIEVSSNNPAQRRKSAKGGNIRLTSRKTTGTAITINSSGDLKALLDAAAPGPGGEITFTSEGGDILVNNGRVTADRGTIDIRNKGASGLVHLNGATLAADVVKVAALGDNGVLRVGGGAIDANTVIQLHAGGSNGTVDFVDDVTLSGSSVKTIAAKTVNIFNGKVVTVTGPAARVFTDNANYTGSGGNGSKTGTFSGSGASSSPFNHPAKPPF